MIQITKTQAIKLNSDYGIPFKDEGISHTYSKHGKKYYLTESAINMKAFKQLLKNKK